MKTSTKYSFKKNAIGQIVKIEHRLSAQERKILIEMLKDSRYVVKDLFNDKILDAIDRLKTLGLIKENPKSSMCEYILNEVIHREDLKILVD